MPFDPRNFKSISTLGTDQILKVYKGTDTIGAAPSIFVPTDKTTIIPSGYTAKTFFVGLFSVDNGVTWNNIGVRAGDVDTFLTADDGTLELNMSNYALAGKTVLYKIASIAKDQDWIDPTFTDQDIQFSSLYNYQKIAVEDTQVLNIAPNTRPTITVNHNLGYIPQFRSWADFGFDGKLHDTGTLFKYDGYTQIEVSTTQVIFEISNIGNPNFNPMTIYTRVYYDD